MILTNSSARYLALKINETDFKIYRKRTLRGLTVYLIVPYNSKLVNTFLKKSNDLLGQ